MHIRIKIGADERFLYPNASVKITKDRILKALSGNCVCTEINLDPLAGVDNVCKYVGGLQGKRMGRELP
jgi:hypothetical protein